jgi:hypothetical protein
LVFWVLLNRTDGTDGTTLRTDEVFETNRKEVAFINSKVFTSLEVDGLFKELDHVIKTFSLLGNSSQKDLLFHLKLVY